MAKSKNIVPASPGDYKRAFIKSFQGFSRQYQRWSIFSHFVELAALAISNRCDMQNYEEREARYLALIKSYEDIEDRRRFPELLALATMCFNRFGPHDFFGEVFSDQGLDLGNKHMGQFFTPFDVSLMMATMTLQDCKALVERDGFFTMLEPASGSGGMIAAAAEAVARQSLDFREVLHVTAVDLDLRCTHMTYLTCCLLDIPAIVYNGDSLGREPMRSVWVTPRHVFGGWRAKLAARKNKEMLSASPLWQALQAAE